MLCALANDLTSSETFLRPDGLPERPGWNRVDGLLSPFTLLGLPATWDIPCYRPALRGQAPCWRPALALLRRFELRDAQHAAVLVHVVEERVEAFACIPRGDEEEAGDEQQERRQTRGAQRHGEVY